MLVGSEICIRARPGSPVAFVEQTVGPDADAAIAALGDGDVPEIDGISAGGMPERVKCLHVLVAHALAAGPGINPLGDEALAMLPTWWATGPCVGPPADSPSVSGGIIGA